MKIFTERLKQIRKKRDLSQADLAEYLQCSRQSYAHYETGRSEPSLETLVKIATYLQCSLDYLLGLSDDSTQRDLTPAEREALQKAAADIKGYETTDEELAAKLPADIREGILALIRLERDKHNNN